MSGIILDGHDKKMAIESLVQLRDEMLDKLCEMKNIIEQITDDEGRMIVERMNAYWWTSIDNNLQGGMFSMCDFESTLKELQELITNE
jgi:hypothetical protein